MDADESLTLSGALTQSGNITIDVADNKTLTYSGAALNLGANTLTLSGGGTLSNTNALVLNHANSLLTLAGILVIGDVDGTTASNSGKGIKVTSSATLGDYDLSAVSYLSIAANKTLAGQLNLQSNGELNISGLGRYTGDIALAGGKFSATDSQVLSGTLSITADSELRVSENYILTLSQTGGLVSWSKHADPERRRKSCQRRTYSRQCQQQTSPELNYCRQRKYHVRQFRFRCR